jgi:hypothetical protein
LKIESIVLYILYIFQSSLVAKVIFESKKLEHMNSQILKQNGFSEPCAIKNMSFSSIPLNKSIVFVILDATLAEKAPSDILYIGRSKRPIRRILGGYIGGYGGKNTKKISSSLIDDGFIEKASIAWVASDKPKAMQTELINKFVQEHGEFPLWNSSKRKGKKPQRKSKPVPAAKPKPTVSPAKAAKSRKVAKPAKQIKTTAPAKVVTPPKPAEPVARLPATPGPANSNMAQKPQP